jgi:uncharacterized protein (DUF305 family)
MKINYKYTTIIFLILFVFMLGVNINNQNDSNSGKYKSSKMNNMHMMPDGSMMPNDVDMHSMMGDMSARMQGKTGDELDKIFLEDMIIHHEGAVDMALILKDKTVRPELKKMAEDIIAVQNKEIEMMQGWLAEWFK